MPKPSEVAFLDTFLKWCIDEYHAVVWTEVITPLGTADAVLSIDDEFTVVEGKKELSYGLLSQCLRWNKLASRVVAVIPYMPRTSESFDLARNHFYQHGVGIHMVGGYVSTVANPHYAGQFDGIREYLRDSQLYDGKFAKAGTAGGRRATARNEKYLEIEEYVFANPFCTASEAAKIGKMKASTLLKLIKKGDVKVGTMETGGKTELVALD